MSRSPAIVVILAAGLPMPARAQVPESLPPNDPIRLMRVSVPGIWQQGRVQAWPDGSVVLRLSPSDTMTIPLDDIARFQTKTGTRRHTGPGALVGGLAGLGAGLAWLAIANPDTDDTARGFIVVTYFALPGAGLGALVGARIRTPAWEDAPLPGESWHDPGGARRGASR